MSQEVQILRIVIASPGDVQAERDLLPAVIDELNSGIARDRDLRLELARWETDAYPGFHPEGPQGLIDPILRIEDCDVLIGIFWKRFGTPTQDAKSGTEHEFRLAYEAWQQKGRPHLMVYFNQKAATPKTKNEIDQWGQVLEFQQNFPKEGLWWLYKGRVQFEKLVRKHLTLFIRQQSPRAAEVPAATDRQPTDRIAVRNTGSGTVAVGAGTTAAGAGGVAVGGHVYGDIYHVYQAPQGYMALAQRDFERIVEDYLRWVQNAYGKARLYGLESLPTAQGRPVRDLSKVFVPLTLC